MSNFTCLDGKEISFEKFCDGNMDCDDNSDEINETIEHDFIRYFIFQYIFKLYY